jgi:hypothetical protein
MTTAVGAGESDATIVLAGMPACRILISSFGRAVLAIRPDTAGPALGSSITVSSAVAGMFCRNVTEGPTAGPLDELARLQPASRLVATAAIPIRPTRWVSLLIRCSSSYPAGHRRGSSDVCRR